MRCSNRHIDPLSHWHIISLIGLLFLASCSKEGETEPGGSATTGRTVRKEICYQVQPMESAESGDGTRATTPVPLSEDEAKIHSLRVLQFGGTADGSLLLKNEKVDVSKINAVTGRFDFEFEELMGGGDITVYLIANVDDYYLPTLTVNTTTLKEFRESCIKVLGAYEADMKSDGLPMLASGAFDPATAEPPAFKLKGLYAKVVFSFDTAPGFNPGPFCLSITDTGGGVTVKENTPGDAAVRPASVPTYGGEMYPNDPCDYDGTTPIVCYIPENLAGRNAAITKDEERWGTNVPYEASYWDLFYNNNGFPSLSGLSYKFYPGDGTPQDFNVVRHHLYTIHATLQGTNVEDKRVTLQTANCYMIESGSYNNNKTFTFLATVMGNGATTARAGWNQYEQPIVPLPLKPASAKVLWEQSDPTGAANAAGDVIKLNSVSVVNGTLIQFTAGTKPGNAVIGAFDADGDLIWSWHIWRPESDVSTVTCHTTANGGRDFTMMDRNLGAFNNNVNDVKAYGLLYQWGRKDPFPGATGVSTNDSGSADFSGALAENGYSFAVVNAGVSIQTLLLTPMTFYCDENTSRAGDWSEHPLSHLWGNSYKGGFPVPNPDLGSKSIYDPCPVGYRVPPQDTWSQATRSNSTWDTNGQQLGVGTGTTPTKYFYPAAGVRWGDSDAGKLSGVGAYGYYWSSSPNSNGGMYAGYLYFGSGSMYPESNRSRAHGLSVRCAKE